MLLSFCTHLDTDFATNVNTHRAVKLCCDFGWFDRKCVKTEPKNTHRPCLVFRLVLLANRCSRPVVDVHGSSSSRRDKNKQSNQLGWTARSGAGWRNWRIFKKRKRVCFCGEKTKSVIKMRSAEVTARGENKNNQRALQTVSSFTFISEKERKVGWWKQISFRLFLFC